MANIEIEDMLSSIRRLVSDAPSAPRAGKVETLLLTPAQRVFEGRALGGPVHQDGKNSTADLGEAEADAGAERTVASGRNEPLKTPTLEERIADLEAAIGASNEEFEPEGTDHQDRPVSVSILRTVTRTQPNAAVPDEDIESGSRAPGGDAAQEIDIEAAGVALSEVLGTATPQGASSGDDLGMAEALLVDETEQTFEAEETSAGYSGADAFAFIAGNVASETETRQNSQPADKATSREPLVLVDPQNKEADASQADEPKQTGVFFEAEAKAEGLLVQELHSRDDMAEDARPDDDTPRRDAKPAGVEGFPASQDKKDGARGNPMEAPLFTADPVIFSASASNGPMAQDFGEAPRIKTSLAEPAVLGLHESLIDEDSLREIVSSLVREELRGELGERITSSVRRLIRREIQRALTLKQLSEDDD